MNTSKVLNDYRIAFRLLGPEKYTERYATCDGPRVRISITLRQIFEKNERADWPETFLKYVRSDIFEANQDYDHQFVRGPACIVPWFEAMDLDYKLEWL